jgi:hypothetical protein
VWLALLSCLAVAFGTAPVAWGLAVGSRARWAILALLAYVCMGLNTAIEAAIFTRFGGTAAMLVFNAFIAAFLATGLALLFRSEPLRSWSEHWETFTIGRGPLEWAWRVAAAIVVFPPIYLAFGSLIAPIVVESYRTGQFGLTLPGFGLIIPVQLVRSTLYLAASVPVLVAWRGSRVRLALALGAAHFVFDGLSGMLQSHWLPMPMRIAHTLEILGDSLTYAAVVVALLVRRREDRERVAAGAAADSAGVPGLASSR